MCRSVQFSFTHSHNFTVAFSHSISFTFFSSEDQLSPQNIHCSCRCFVHTRPPLDANHRLFILHSSHFSLPTRKRPRPPEGRLVEERFCGRYAAKSSRSCVQSSSTLTSKLHVSRAAAAAIAAEIAPTSRIFVVERAPSGLSFLLRSNFLYARAGRFTTICEVDFKQ